MGEGGCETQERPARVRDEKEEAEAEAEERIKVSENGVRQFGTRK